jgi:glutathione-regulated potassium-efflux system ancillary protein KefC
VLAQALMAKAASIVTEGEWGAPHGGLGLRHDAMSRRIEQGPPAPWTAGNLLIGNDETISSLARASMEHAPTWLINTLIYLAAAVVAVPLSKALGLGSILGYLIAGVVIGPWGIGLVSHVQDVLHFAEFGVVLMLFLVGLELEPKRLWALRRPIFGWGSAQVALCAVTLTALAIALGVSWRVALVASLGLALSSTAIALQVMDERGTLRTTSGQSAFSILLFQDVAAIPILALVPLLGIVHVAADAATPAWQSVAKVVGVVAVIVLGGRLAVRPALRWIARSRTPEVFTAASLLVVVAIAALMQWVGLSMALGAFLAGVLLAESEYKHELEADIAPFKGLLLGLFFIAVGMSVDFGALMREPAVLAVVLLVFLGAKLLVIYALATWMGMPLQDRPVFTMLLAQGGEFAFVVFQAAAGAKVFSPDVASLLIGAVALSMLLTPLMLVSIDRWLMPRWATRGASHRPGVDELSEQQDAPVIIAGFGRYGQIVGRLLMANGIRTSVLDHDAQRIESARIFGYRVFYGDATRADLLRLAGGATARVIVVAVDTVAATNRIVDTAKAQFPQAQLVVRVRDLTHAHDMFDRGVTTVDRELFDASLSSARRVLDSLGTAHAEAHRMVQSFHDHNMAYMHTSHEVRADHQQLVAVAKKARADLEQQMAQDRAHQIKVESHADVVADGFGLPKLPPSR